MDAPTPTPARWPHGHLPVCRTPVDTICLALYGLADGRSLRGFLVSTIADRLGIDFYRAAEMADAAHAAGLVRHEHGTVTLTVEGLARRATLKQPTASSWSARPAGRSRTKCRDVKLPRRA